MSAFGGKADMAEVTAACQVLTQSGHQREVVWITRPLDGGEGINSA